MSANRYVPGFASTTARSSKRAKEFGFCPSFCPPKVPGSTPSSRSGCMPRRLLWNPMVCSRLSSWLNAFVLTLAAPMNPLFPLSKRLRDYALGHETGELHECLRLLIHFVAHCFVQVPQPFDWKPLSEEEMVTIVGALTLLFVIMSSIVPPNPLSLA